MRFILIIKKLRLHYQRFLVDLRGVFVQVYFRVATVVTKLFNIVSPDVAIFGKKDYQQLAIIKMLVKQLSMNVKIISGETIRDEDGLALSSRNRYLDKTEREIAPQLNVVIKEIKESLEKKDTNYVAMEYEAGQVLSRKGWDVDYVVIRTQMAY